jgi:hypothetical protein
MYLVRFSVAFISFSSISFSFDLAQKYASDILLICVGFRILENVFQVLPNLRIGF